jgi:hypothetical protein
MLKKAWNDPVWSKVISGAIIAACGLAISLLQASHVSFGDSFSTTLDFAGRVVWLTMAFIGCWLLVLAVYRLRRADKATLAQGEPQRSGSDVYRDVGKGLVGQWAVRYEVNFGEKPLQTVGGSRTVGCYISMSPLEGLELRLDMKDDPLHTGVEEVVIRDVALRYNEVGGFTMFYYYRGTISIWPHVAQSVVGDAENRRPDEVAIEYFGLVRFDKPTVDGVVRKMKGTWYDLNGNITRLLTLLDAKKTAHIKETHFEPMRLSEVLVQQKSLAADMGLVEFNRQ